ncbi:Bug family tripartite tricarboxylate transporter substrate binding protein [Cupriavidus sp. CuC1]|uniref:Bug family tripartite tricarboxylate transporter substrate binding protein n=1 Tax=Cupriavidus sp. CuC1 TaxID=3373131 RepID=UPI0037D6725C
MVVENKAGAAGTIGASQVAKATADGYTLMWTGNGPLTLSPFLYPSAHYDPAKSFVPIGIGAMSSYVLAVSSTANFTTLEGLVAEGKRREASRTLTYASNGQNGSLHLLALLLAAKSGMKALHVPYKGGASGVTALLAGEVDFTFDAVSTALPFIRSGKLRALAITGSKRDPALPTVPTLGESGMPSLTFDVFYGLLAPAGTPQPVVEKLAMAMQRAVADPEIQKAIKATGNVAQSRTPVEFGSMIGHEASRWQSILREQGISATAAQ